ncbi:lactaldehyde dehydrogenase [Methanobrevibacter curvatus]|uniref:Lactaldehyde dehydrogenase n=1 Tax=Methanobrevibacter curvatus TaxID=49547 RepID=A0A166DWK4_9EURY|nr:lactaldehyde dehydrogenase [Methanobrevibacter curvatus]KZX16026.1 sulfoacetaldehyde dehydrogenase [Methanobrevibacter curvatus]
MTINDKTQHKINKKEKKNTINIINPYNQKIIIQLEKQNIKDLKKLISNAKMGQKELIDFSSRKISNALYTAFENLKHEKKKIAKILTEETGKPIKDSIVEMDRSIETLKFSAEESKRIYGESVPLDAGLGGKGFFAFTQKVPLGLVVAITPFNYPVNLAIHKIGPAIASKNSCILKPSLKAPLAAIEMSKIISSEFPQGVLSTVLGGGSELSNELITNPNVDKITFTGSVEVGKLIASKAGMKKVSLELGGNDPLIILKDANLEKAVKGAVNGAYLFAGQVCMGVKRIIVENEIADEFLQSFKKETEKLRVGNPMNKNTDIGPLIDEEAAKIVEKSVQNMIDTGADLITGGKRKDNFYTPTILDNIDGESSIIKQELFGPVAPVIRVKDVDEAIKIANNTEFGLQAGVYTENIHNGLKVANEIIAGSVFINKQSTFRTDNMPFGGFKNSGVGKEGVKYAIDEMTKTKLIGLNLR